MTDSLARYEVSALIGPCHGSQARAVLDAIANLTLVRELGGSCGVTVWHEPDGEVVALRGRVADAEGVARRLREALAALWDDHGAKEQRSVTVEVKRLAADALADGGETKERWISDRDPGDETSEP